jgi:hypothetical protein
MSRRNPKYPVQKVLDRLIPEFYSWRTDFVEKLGYENLGVGRIHLDSGLDRAEVWNGFLQQVAAAYPDLAEELEKAIAETEAMRAAESDLECRERCKSEEASWVPFLQAVVETTVPNGITIFAVSGGFKKWTVIQIPEALRRLAVEAQLTHLPELMAAYRHKHRGLVPFFGRLTGFKFVRPWDHYRFSPDGDLLGHVPERFRLGAPGWSCVSGASHKTHLPDPPDRETEDAPVLSGSTRWIALKFPPDHAENTHMTSEGHRVEHGVKSRGQFQLLVNGAEALTTTVYHTAPFGISLEAVTPVGTGTAVRLDGEGFIADGVVRYCNSHGGTYRIGICFVPVRSQAEQFG